MAEDTATASQHATTKIHTLLQDSSDLSSDMITARSQEWSLPVMEGSLLRPQFWWYGLQTHERGGLCSKPHCLWHLRGSHPNQSHLGSFPQKVAACEIHRHLSGCGLSALHTEAPAGALTMGPGLWRPHWKEALTDLPASRLPLQTDSSTYPTYWLPSIGVHIDTSPWPRVYCALSSA